MAEETKRKLSPQFEAAVSDSTKLTTKPGSDDLLSLYALYKQATQNPSIENAPKPGTFDFVGKKKRERWETLVSDGVTPEEAEKKYVDKVETLKESHGYDANKVPEQISRGG